MSNKNLTHLHVHTFYSLLDGMGSPEERVIRAKELGMKEAWDKTTIRCRTVLDMG